MGLFSRKVKAEFASAPIKAAAGVAGSGIGSYYTYTVGTAELQSLSVGVISRARDLMAALIGGLEFKHYSKQWTGEKYEEIYLPLESWMERPDPNNTRNFILANTLSDLFFYGRAWWYITARSATTGKPTAFQWLPAGNVSTLDQAGPQFFADSHQIEFNGVEIDWQNVVQFRSPSIGIVYTGARNIQIAMHLDSAIDRYATIEQVPGYLQQKNGETLSGEELGDLAAAWVSARKDGSVVGALNDYVEFIEYKRNPMEVVAEQRVYQALELSRIANVPPYLLGIDTGSYQYQTSVNARQDLYLFGAKPYLDCIEQTLSMDNVLPRGRFVEFNTEDLFASSTDESVMVEPEIGVSND